MKYIHVRSKLKLLRKGASIAMLICFLMIMGLSKPANVHKSVKFIAAPIIKPFLDQFKSNGREYTNIFNL